MTRRLGIGRATVYGIPGLDGGGDPPAHSRNARRRNACAQHEGISERSAFAARSPGEPIPDENIASGTRGRIFDFLKSFQLGGAP
jgi:hypothetical protein